VVAQLRVSPDRGGSLNILDAVPVDQLHDPLLRRDLLAGHV
jgi:hypothetical protein